jgi:hypothetical protein
MTGFDAHPPELPVAMVVRLAQSPEPHDADR